MGWINKLFKNNKQVPPSLLPRRNDPCWCDSGLKYKKCHLSKDKIYFKEHPKTKKVAAKKSCSPAVG